MATLISGSTGVNKITDGTIVNADIASGAAIAGTKLVMPTGSVIQVVSTSVNTQTSVTSQSFTNISTQATITPKFSNSKILITFNSGVCYQNTANATYYFYGSFFRGSTNIANNSSYPYIFGSYQGGLSFSDDHGFTLQGQKLDSPSTTSAVTYKVMCLNQTANLEVVINYKGESCMTLMEIAG